MKRKITFTVKQCRILAGMSMFLFLLLAINEAGTNRITYLENFLSLLWYIALFLLSFLAWEKCGGNMAA